MSQLWMPTGKSQIEQLSPQFIQSLSPQEKTALLYNWSIWARPKQLPPPNNIIEHPLGWKYWLILAGRFFGKALDINTPILTINGWKTMESLQIGDFVFAPDGTSTQVTFATEIMNDHNCYQITFNDGSTIIADEEHLWMTCTKSYRKNERRSNNFNYQASVLSTKQIKESLMIGKEFNHSIPTTEPINLPEQKLLINPYILGLWLGDGSSAGGSLTCNDPQIIEEINKLGYRTTKHKANYMYGILGLHVQLKELLLLNNKHIPEKYLYSSIDQRLSLLQGLMDTDGTISKTGSCTFDNTNKSLVEGVKWLAESLGIKTSKIVKKQTFCNGKVCQPCFRIWFTTNLNVFKLQRKLDRIKQTYRRNNSRTIIKVELVSSVPVRCIQVDHPSHLFLAGKELIPTHNTRTAAELIRNKVINNEIRRIALIGPTHSDVLKVMIHGESGLMNVFPPHQRPKYVGGEKKTLTFHNGAEAFVYTAEEPERLRGPQHDFAWLDEVAAFNYLEGEDGVWSLFLAGLRLGKAQCVITTTPKPRKLFFDLLENPRTIVTYGGSEENKANIADGVLEEVQLLYGNTDFAAQELHGQLLSEASGAIFKASWIKQYRVTQPPKLKKTIIAIDTSGSGKDNSCECGIVVAGLGTDNKGYLLKDLSLRASPEQWVKVAYKAYQDYQADYIVYEGNYGGELPATIFRLLNLHPKLKQVFATAGKDKVTRAQPIAALMQKGLICLVNHHPQLEMQLTTWVRQDRTSPDRLDAFVWAFTEFFDGIIPGRGLTSNRMF